MLVRIGHQVFDLSADKDHLAYATSKAAGSDRIPDEYQIVEPVGGFQSSVKFTYTGFLLDDFLVFTLSWSARYCCLQTAAPTWSSELSKSGT